VGSHHQSASPHAHNPGTTPGTCLSPRTEAIQARRQDHGPSNLGTWFRRLVVTASQDGADRPL